MAKGGARPGAGRKTIKTEREVKERLQKLLPDAYRVIQASLKGDNRIPGPRVTAAFKLLDKFVGDRQAVKYTTEGEVPTGVIVLPPLRKDSKKLKAGRPKAFGQGGDRPNGESKVEANPLLT